MNFIKKIIVLLSITFILSSCSKDTPQKMQSKDAASITVSTMGEFQDEDPDDYAFDGSLNTFKEYFNSIAENLALDVFINDFKIDGDKFEADLDDRLYKGTKLFGELDKSNNVKTVTLVCEKAEEKNEILRYNLLMEGIIAITTPGMDTFQRGDFIEKLGMPEDDTSLKDGTKVIQKDKHTYTLTMKGDKLTFVVAI